MTLNQLKYVIEIAKTGSINKAAGNLFMSQSALSTSIQRLEGEFGSPIFVRTQRGIQLTRFGQSLLSYLAPIQMQIDQLSNMAAAKDLLNYMQSLSIASNAFHFISNILADMYWKYRAQGIRIELHETYSYSVLDLVASRAAEVGIVRFWSCYKGVNLRQIESLKLEYYPFAISQIGISVGEKNPLFRKKEDIFHAEELREYPAIVNNILDSGPYADIYDRLGLPKAPSRIVVNSRSATYEALGHTDGYYLSSRSQFQSDKRASSFPFPQRFLYLSDCPIQAEIGWVKAAANSLSPLASEFIRHVSDYYSGY